jgi:hypothetical protein
LGKAFQGYIPVELTGEEEAKELFELLSYIKQNAKQFQCRFTTRMLDRAEEIKNCLEEHFFVRKIEGKEYENSEQSTVFLRVLLCGRPLNLPNALKMLGKKSWFSCLTRGIAI